MALESSDPWGAVEVGEHLGLESAAQKSPAEEAEEQPGCLE